MRSRETRLCGRRERACDPEQGDHIAIVWRHVKKRGGGEPRRLTRGYETLSCPLRDQVGEYVVLPRVVPGNVCREGGARKSSQSVRIAFTRTETALREANISDEFSLSENCSVA